MSIFHSHMLCGVNLAFSVKDDYPVKSSQMFERYRKNSFNFLKKFKTVFF